MWLLFQHFKGGLPALTMVNNHHVPLHILRYMFSKADRHRLRVVSDPLPGPGPFRPLEVARPRHTSGAARGSLPSHAAIYREWFARWRRRRCWPTSMRAVEASRNS